MRALIVINESARRGEARARYARVQSIVEAGLHAERVAFDRGGGDSWRRTLDASLRDGVRFVVAAGGDGTVGAVVNALVARDAPVPLEEIRFGAVGLGSSNDFQKPIRTVANGIPLRLGASRPRDVARAVWTDEKGVERSRHFVVSASIGATADANRRFSDRSAIASFLGAHCVDAAIAWAAARTLAAHRNVEARISVGADTHTFALSNLSVMKTPYLSGSFRYDTPVAPSSGTLAVNLCHGMGRMRLFRTLASLACGRFAGLPGTRAWLGEHVDVTLAEARDLELDGELFRARRVRFEVLKDRLMVCS